MGLETVFDALSVLSVTYDTVTPDVYNFDELPNSVEDAMLPCRLLMPYQERNAGGDFGWLAMGKSYKATWQVVDLMLLKATGQGGPIDERVESMVHYLDAHRTMAKNNRSIGLSQAHWTELRYNTGQYEYAGVTYFAVEAVWTVEEFGSG